MHDSTRNRLLTIKEALKDASKTGDQLLAILNERKHKGVSARNLIKDIKSLRTGALNNLPLNIDFTNGRYRLIDTGIASHYTELSVEDQTSLLLAREYLAPLANLPAGAELIIHLNDAMGLPPVERSFYVLRTRKPQLTEVNSMQANLVFRRLTKIHEAIQKGISVEFLYIVVRKERNHDASEFIQSLPLKVAEWNGRFYLFALPLNHKENPSQDKIRVFPLDAIASKIMVNEEHTFDWSLVTSSLNMESYFDDCIGIWNAHDVQPVKRTWLFKGWAASHVRACPLHPSQEIREINGTNDVRVSLFVKSTPELDREIAQYREYAIEII
jgi:predicted DNA-binding transcriptional regulator YafY